MRSEPTYGLGKRIFWKAPKAKGWHYHWLFPSPLAFGAFQKNELSQSSVSVYFAYSVGATAQTQCVVQSRPVFVSSNAVMTNACPHNYTA